MTENLVHRGIAVTLVEKLPQVMPPFDPEMMAPVHAHLQSQGVKLCLNDGVQGFVAGSDNNLIVQTDSGQQHPAEMVILAIGVRPENGLAKETGLELGDRGGIRVNSAMQTSDPHIWAVGDAVEVQDFVTQEWTLIPLAGPANRQGRIAAETILGRNSQFRGVQGTSVCGIFGMTVASTGASEKTLQRGGMDYHKVYLHPGHHAGYFPGAKAIAIKLLYAPTDGRILGAQAVGADGTEKRIDVLAMAIQAGMTVFDLEEAELCYAPQFGAAKDPVNMAGMIAANALRGDAPIAYWENLDLELVNLVDVREESEFERGHVVGATNIPLSQLRQRIKELPCDRPLWIYCQVGQRGYYATRVLRQLGFDAHNLTGGYKTYECNGTAGKKYCGKSLDAGFSPYTFGYCLWR
ncbi:putative NADH oxidase [Calothrix sp. NIES-3974]|nr:putative NADH oxidase [Calothrix sp. NIES-3974]